MTYLLPNGAKYNGQGAIVFPGRAITTDKKVKLLEGRVEELERTIKEMKKMLEEQNVSTSVDKQIS